MNVSMLLQLVFAHVLVNNIAIVLFTATLATLVVVFFFSWKKRKERDSRKKFLSAFYDIYCHQTGARSGSPQHDPLIPIYLVAEALGYSIGDTETEFAYSGHTEDGKICFGSDPKLGSKTLPYILDEKVCMMIAEKLLKSDFTPEEQAKLKIFFGKSTVFFLELEPYDVDNLFALVMVYHLSKVLDIPLIVNNHSVYHTPAAKPVKVVYPKVFYSKIDDSGREEPKVGTLADMRNILDSQATGEYGHHFAGISARITEISRAIDYDIISRLCPGVDLTIGSDYNGTGGDQVISSGTHMAPYKFMNQDGSMKTVQEYEEGLERLRGLTPDARCTTALIAVQSIPCTQKVPKLNENTLLKKLSAYQKIYNFSFGGCHCETFNVLQGLSRDGSRQIYIFRQGGIVPTQRERYETTGLMQLPANQGMDVKNWGLVSQLIPKCPNVHGYILSTNSAKASGNSFMWIDLSKYM